jgi:hypothetical protein
VLKSGTARSNPINRSKRSMNPVVRRSAMPNGPFIVRQVWMAVSQQVCCRPRLPVAAASRLISGSNRIVSAPRRLSASLQAGQLRVLWAGGVGLLMQPSHHAGFTR